MPVRPVVRYPHAVLKLPAADLAPGSWAESVAADLVDTMRASPACVGLAAPQLGIGARAFAVDITGHKRARSCNGLIVMINPSIVQRDGSETIREGCMSVPDFTGNVARATRVLVRGMTPAGAPAEIEADAFEARALQHEIDHLDGLLFLDRVASMAADVFRRRTYR